MIFILVYCIEVKSHFDKTRLKNTIWTKRNNILLVIYNVNFWKCDNMLVTCVMQSKLTSDPVHSWYDLQPHGDWQLVECNRHCNGCHHNPHTTQLITGDTGDGGKCSSTGLFMSLQMEVWTWLAVYLRPQSHLCWKLHSNSCSGGQGTPCCN